MMLCPSETNNNEIWKPIPGYEGIYDASNYGKIRTAKGKTTYTLKHGSRLWESRILKTRGNGKAGYRVSLWKNGKPKDFLTARAVAMAFLGVPKINMTVNHIDGNRFNNCVENLEWLSLADNIRHAFETNLMPTQKAVMLKTENEATKHISMARASRYIGRNPNYISLCIKKNKNAMSNNGIYYQIEVLETTNF